MADAINRHKRKNYAKYFLADGAGVGGKSAKTPIKAGHLVKKKKLREGG